jgi:hypothetical protein
MSTKHVPGGGAARYTFRTECPHFTYREDYSDGDTKVQILLTRSDIQNPI